MLNHFTRLVPNRFRRPWGPLGRANRRRSARATNPGVEYMAPRITPSVTLANWMSTVPNMTLLSRMSIPGTHDTMTYSTSVPWAKTQDTSLSEQLNDGVRFLDIRLGGLQVPGGTSQTDLGVYHRSFYLDATFVSDVIATCQTFLAENPSETVIMSIKDDHPNGLSTTAFASIADKIIADSYKNGDRSDGPLFYTGTSVPDLGQVRGQIVLFRRYTDSRNEGINASSWPDNPSSPFTLSATFEHRGSGSIIGQDHYEPAGSFFDVPLFTNYEELKEANIDKLIEMANSEPAGGYNWYIDFASATDVTSGPHGFASYENQALDSFLPTIHGLVGTIVMDFPENDLNWEIIDHNP